MDQTTTQALDQHVEAFESVGENALNSLFSRPLAMTGETKWIGTALADENGRALRPPVWRYRLAYLVALKVTNCEDAKQHHYFVKPAQAVEERGPAQWRRLSWMGRRRRLKNRQYRAARETLMLEEDIHNVVIMADGVGISELGTFVLTVWESWEYDRVIRELLWSTAPDALQDNPERMDPRKETLNTLTPGDGSKGRSKC